MSKSNNNSKSLIDYKVDIKIKLAALWTSLMFLYIYADYFRLMTPEKLEKMIKLQTPMGPTTPGLLVIFSLILIVPTLMIFLSVFLRPKINKWLNIIVALLYTCMSVLIIISSISSEWQKFFVFFNIVEVLIFSIIIFQAWNWQKL